MTQGKTSLHFRDWTRQDDLFVYAPSVALVEAGVIEGKSIGTAEITDLALITHLNVGHGSDSVVFAKQRKSGTTVGRRKLREVQQRVRTALLTMIRNHYGGTLGEKKLRENAHRVMKTAWRDVFLAGLRAGGTAGTHKKGMVQLDPIDEKWIRGAMSHEMRYLNGFLKAIVSKTYVMPLERRTTMYVNALKSFYESARVIALPFDAVIHWSGPNDAGTCPGCKYMFEHNPYTKLTLPTTPASGQTPCLTNCRDKLVIRRVAAAKAVKVTEASKFARATHIKHLQTIKRVGHL